MYKYRIDVLDNQTVIKKLKFCPSSWGAAIEAEPRIHNFEDGLVLKNLIKFFARWRLHAQCISFTAALAATSFEQALAVGGKCGLKNV